MIVAPLPDNEEQRLAALNRYLILDTEAEQVFDDLTRLASKICETPIALISIVDRERQWFKSKVGLAATETPRDLAFCAHAILQTDAFVIEDACKDERFADNPFVTDAPHVRFYAGAPLIDADGFKLGTLCVIDHVARKLNEEQREALEILGRQTISQFQLRLQLQKNAETLEALKVTKQAADSANQAKTSFLANMSHEIRTPLNSIVGFSQVLMSDPAFSALSLDFKNYLLNIKTAGENLSELINNILDLSKIEAGKLELFEENLNFKQLLQGIYHINKSGALEKQLNYSYEWDPALPEFIFSDRTKLNQILMNLVSNAIKFTPRGRRVTLQAGKEQDQLIFRVIDEGIGISPDRQEVVFSAFEQADGSTTRQFGGTGLGLTISQKMAELMGGNIELNSQQYTAHIPGGSTFTLRLPLREAAEKTSGDLTIKIEDYQFSSDNLVLVVEDNPMNQQMVQAMFKNLGLEISIADSGHEAIRTVQQMNKNGKLPDLILMDMHMPGMDGLETTQTLRKDPAFSEIPIVALSAEAFTEQQRLAKESGIIDYLTKPLDLNKLLPILEKFLDFRKKSDSPEKEKALSSLPPLPESVRQQILQEWQKFSEFPIFFVDEIIEQAEKIRALSEGFNSIFPDLTNSICEAAYRGDADHFAALVQKEMPL
ncbi:MAG: response regulator [SAR324 cluster bacterium]|nr:response regulator [SAR324 cluster bacterium]